MLENSHDYKFCIKLALDHAKKRIDLLSDKIVNQKKSKFGDF